MLSELRNASSELRILGSYISLTVPEGKPITDAEIGHARKRESP